MVSRALKLPLGESRKIQKSAGKPQLSRVARCQFGFSSVVSAIFKAAQNPSEFGVKATSGHRIFISA
jgi:hypothetical protein